MTSVDHLLHAAALESLAAIVARAGRALAVADRRKGLALKADGSPATAADRDCEAALAAALAEAFPGLAIVGEESAAADAHLPPDRAVALIDPLDGTRAFAEGRDDFCINLAIVIDGAPVIGIIGAPARGALYAGSIMPGRRQCWRAAVRADGTLAPERIDLAARRPAASPPVALASERHGDARSTALMDGLGVSERVGLSSALKFAFLAEGGADLYPRLAPTMAWDTAAGQAILAAAGGATLAETGAELAYPPGRPLRNPGFIATGDPALARRAAALLGG